MKNLSQLKFMRVVTEDGEFLGHVFDFRSRGAKAQRKSGKQAETGCAIDELIYGRKGFLERLGFSEPDVQTISWSAVVKMYDDRLIVALNRRVSQRSRKR